MRWQISAPDGDWLFGQLELILGYNIVPVHVAGKSWVTLIMASGRYLKIKKQYVIISLRWWQSNPNKTCQAIYMYQINPNDMLHCLFSDRKHGHHHNFFQIIVAPVASIYIFIYYDLSLNSGLLFDLSVTELIAVKVPMLFLRNTSVDSFSLLYCGSQ